MTNTEIDRRLALAIGYLPEHVKTYADGSVAVRRPKPAEPIQLYKVTK